MTEGQSDGRAESWKGRVTEGQSDGSIFKFFKIFANICRKSSIYIIFVFSSKLVKNLSSKQFRKTSCNIYNLSIYNSTVM